MVYLSTVLLSVFITVSLIPLMTLLADRYQLLVDFPDSRKVHTRPVPRIGGLATALGASLPVILWATADGFVKAYLAGAGVLVVFGLLDDFKGLGYKAKFTGQIIAALVVVLYGGVRIGSLGTLLPGTVQLPEWSAILLSLVAVVGATNAINLADGLDGLAGGISLLGFCCIGYFAYLQGNVNVILLSLSFAGAIFGFLRFNTHPASLFMGDTGSQLLGFSAVVFAVKITQGESSLSPVLPLIILGFPILDTLTVMVERVREGRSPFSPDKNHFHHRLIRIGFTHAEAVVAIYMIQATMIISAIFLRYYTDWVLIFYYAIFSALIIGAFAITNRIGFKFSRKPLIDFDFLGCLRIIKDRSWVIKISFTFVKIIIPMLLLFSCFLPARLPREVSLFAAFFGSCILVSLLFFSNRLAFWLRIALYPTVTLILYLIEAGRVGWMSEQMFNLYHFSFGAIAFFALLTTKFSRRMKGFRVTTMDFLIIFIAVVIPNLPEQSIQSYHLGLLSVEIIVLLFSIEVLITELRENYNVLLGSALMTLAVIGIRGGTGF
jgi:UDP-GlcNAc:undecaprenyl-phosphate/decaprenyl-phosphate GlcNAc-1-phosphate transferase